MREVVLDASVVVEWIRAEDEPYSAQAQALQQQYRRGELVVIVPRLMFLELVNVAARRWAWSRDQLRELVGVLLDAEFGTAEPPLDRVAHWASRGLTAYDACYVALAEERRTILITADERILAVAGNLAESLADTPP